MTPAFDAAGFVVMAVLLIVAVYFAALYAERSAELAAALERKQDQLDVYRAEITRLTGAVGVATTEHTSPSFALKPCRAGCGRLTHLTWCSEFCHRAEDGAHHPD